MSLELVSMSTGVGYLKAGFYGFQGSGKTHTATVLALGLRKQLKLKGPIAMFDTEGGAQYIGPWVKKETGKDLLGVQSRAFDDVLEFMEICLRKKVSVAIVDSATHLWKELVESYLTQLNQALQAAGKLGRSSLELRDWGPLKEKWGKFPTRMLTIPLHFIVLGRAGYEWDMELNEESGRRELRKTGTKMKAEGEFGHEPGLLIEMEQIRVSDQSNGKSAITHRATILKDRFRAMDGMQQDNPDYKFFMPHTSMLTKGAVATVDMSRTTEHGVDVAGDANWQREKRQRDILREKIQNEMVKRFPGQTQGDKRAKIWILEKSAGTNSWIELETFNSGRLENVLAALPVAFKEWPDFLKQEREKTEKTKGGAK